MLLQPHDGSGWAEVELLSESNGGMESGFVPWGYLQQCPPDGAMVAVFQGQTEGEVSEATEGEGVLARKSNPSCHNTSGLASRL